jgi:hypothetical protein
MNVQQTMLHTTIGMPGYHLTSIVTQEIWANLKVLWKFLSLNFVELTNFV